MLLCAYVIDLVYSLTFYLDLTNVRRSLSLFIHTMLWFT